MESPPIIADVPPLTRERAFVESFWRLHRGRDCLWVKRYRSVPQKDCPLVVAVRGIRPSSVAPTS